MYIHAVAVYQYHDESVSVHSLLHIVNLLEQLVNESVASFLCLLPLNISLAKRVHVSRTGHSVSSDKPAKRMICLLTCNCGKVCSVDTSGIARWSMQTPL